MSHRILAIDDSRTIRAMLRTALVGVGFVVDVAEDGVEGLEKLDDVTPDLVITDLNMPRLDGFGFIEKVRAQPTHMAVPILVLTTESGEDLKRRARAAGATGWIVKPFDADKLVMAINRLVI